MLINVLSTENSNMLSVSCDLLYQQQLSSGTTVIITVQGYRLFKNSYILELFLSYTGRLGPVNNLVSTIPPDEPLANITWTAPEGVSETGPPVTYNVSVELAGGNESKLHYVHCLRMVSTLLIAGSGASLYDTNVTTTYFELVRNFSDEHEATPCDSYIVRVTPVNGFYMNITGEEDNVTAYLYAGKQAISKPASSVVFSPAGFSNFSASAIDVNATEIYSGYILFNLTFPVSINS